MDTIEFGNTSKYVFAFRVPSEFGSEEPPAKKNKRDTFAIPDIAPLKDLSKPIEKVVSEEQINGNYFQTLQIEKLHEELVNAKHQLNSHSARIDSLERIFVQEQILDKYEFQRKECDEKRISNHLQAYQVFLSTSNS